jgi:hypothetical protein
LELFLEFGADIPLWYCALPTKNTEETKGTWQMTLGDKTFPILKEEISLVSLLQSLQEKDGPITVQDCVEHWNPHNAGAIVCLLDKETKGTMRVESPEDAGADVAAKSNERENSELEEGMEDTLKASAMLQTNTHGIGVLAWYEPRRLLRSRAMPWFLFGKCSST